MRDALWTPCTVEVINILRFRETVGPAEEEECYNNPGFTSLCLSVRFHGKPEPSFHSSSSYTLVYCTLNVFLFKIEHCGS